MIDFALEKGAPFIDTALGRLHAGIFGSGRAARSTDVAIINTLNKTFRITANKCHSSGGWSSTLLPEYEIPPKSSVAYGAESHGFMTGLSDCKVEYKSTDGQATFWVSVSNPYYGSNYNDKGHTGAVRNIQIIAGNGNNNVVKFVLEG